MRKYIVFGCYQIIYAISYVLGLWLICHIATNLGLNIVQSKDIFLFCDIYDGISISIIYILILLIALLIDRVFVVFRKKINIFIFILYGILAIVFLKNISIEVNIIYSFIYIVGYMMCKCFSVFRKVKIAGKTRNANIFSENTVDKSMLSTNQRKVLEDIIELVDDRDSHDSINVALASSWGSGKTSIIDSFVDMIDNRESGNRYFILKINILTFSKITDLVEYVSDYFEELFFEYSVDFSAFMHDFSYLSLLSDLLDEKKSSVVRNIVNNIWNADKFIDIETERELYSNKIQKLLNLSGRKNIILIIDDADRSEFRDKIIRLLLKFSSIEGIICLILLGEDYYFSLRPDGTEEFKEIKKFHNIEGIEKYIHATLKIEDDTKIENEKAIREYLCMAYDRINRKKEFYYMNCSNMNGHSLLNFNISFSTRTSAGITQKKNILYDIFFENLKAYKYGFGELLENIVISYFNNCEEVKKLEKINLNLPNEYKNVFRNDNMLMWNIYKNIPDDNFEWFSSISNSIMQMMGSLLLLMNTLKNNEEKKLLKKGTLDSIFVLNDLIYKDIFKSVNQEPYEMMLQDNIPSEVKNYTFTNTICILFGEDIDSINKFIKTGEFDKVSYMLKEKYSKLSTLMLMVLTVSDFIFYIRKIMNNYRMFKIQLRESIILNLNYLDYLLCDWKPSKKNIDSVNAYKENMSFKDDVNLSWSSFKDYICNMIYSKYIIGYGENDIAEQIKVANDVKSWLTEFEGKKYIVINLQIDDRNEIVVKNISGEILNSISDLFEKKIQDELLEMSH